MHEIDTVRLYECTVSVEYEGKYTGGAADPKDVPLYFVEIRSGRYAGYGECLPCNLWFIPGQSAEMNYDELEALLGICQALLGKDPLGLGNLIPDSIRRHDTNNIVDAADFALHDLVGKIYGIPLRGMLGGSQKPFVWALPVIYRDEPEAMAAKASEWHRQYGFRYFKLKPVGDTDADEETINKIREKTAADVKIFEDPNLGLRMTGDELVVYLNRLAASGLALCEDPIDADLQTYADVRRRSRVPIMIDFRSRTVKQVAAILKAGAADAINIHANQAGGFQQGLQRAHFAWTAGVQSMVGSTLYLGTGTAAYNILSSLLPGNLPCEQLEIEVYGGTSAVRNRFPIRDGKIFIEDRPGIGVELDMSVIEQRCRKVHELR
jgi:L-alanine-DL-glutamate epimerase-like enolase superfamily enzyme